MVIPKVITKEWLLEKVKDSKESNFIRLISIHQMDKIPREFITKEVISKEVDSVGSNALLITAGQRSAHKIPQNLITDRLLFTTNNYGMNAFSLLCMKGDFGVIPEKTLNDFLLERVCREESTPLHYLALHGKLSKKQSKVLNRETLNLKDKSGESVLYYAVKGGNLRKIPKEFITTDWVLSYHGGDNASHKYLPLKEILHHEEDGNFIFPHLSTHAAIEYLPTLIKLSRRCKEIIHYPNKRTEQLNRFIEKIIGIRNLRKEPSLKI